MQVLVTGHQGYVGTVLCELLARRGHSIYGLDVGYLDGCDFGSPPRTWPSIRRDIRDSSLPDFRQVEAVVHLAALSTDSLSNLDQDSTMSINFLQAVRLATMAKRSGASRFIFASSCSVYGRTTKKLSTERDSPQPETPYGTSKRQAELGIHALADASFSPMSLRIATVYGSSPRLRFDSPVNKLVAWACTSDRIPVPSNGREWRPLIHVDDLCAALVAALEEPRGIIHDKILNIGGAGQNYTLGEIAARIKRELPSAEIVFDAGASSNLSYRVDFSAASHVLSSFRPAHSLAAGIIEMAADIRKFGLSLDDVQGPRFNRLNQMKHLLAAGKLHSNLRLR